MVRLITLLSFLLIHGVGHATTYVFTGNNYVNPTGVYTTSMRLTGSFTTHALLPANMPLTEIGPKGANLVQSWTFNDGITTWDESNSMALIDLNDRFSVSTDANGDIDLYTIGFMQPMGPHTVGTLMNSFSMAHTSSDYTRVFHQGACFRVNSSGNCDGISSPAVPPGGVVDYLSLPIPSRPATGTFVTMTPAAVTAVAVPAVSGWGLALLGLMLGGLALHRARGQRPLA